MVGGCEDMRSSKEAEKEKERRSELFALIDSALTAPNLWRRDFQTLVVLPES